MEEFQLFLQFGFEFKRVESFCFVLNDLSLSDGELFTLEKSFSGGLRLVVGLLRFLSLRFFFEKFGRGEEVVMKGVPDFVDFIHQRDEISVIDSVVVEELSDVRPVSLLHVGLVVLLIGSSSRDFHRLCSRIEVHEHGVV